MSVGSRFGALGVVAAALALLAIVAACATAPASARPASPENAPGAPAAEPPAAGRTISKAPAVSPEPPVDEPGRREPADAGDVPPEEVTVTGKRIRRWLPIVGADWPDSDCRLSTRNVGHGDLRAVFIADLGRSGKAWRHVARLVARDGVRATLVTLPGSDGNRPCTWRGTVLARSAELVASLLDDVGAPVSLVGDTFGAHVALEVALRDRPDAVHNLVLYDFVPYPWPLQNILFKAYRLAHPPSLFANQARVLPPAYLSASSNLAFPETDYPDEDVRAELLQAYRRSDPVTVAYGFYRNAGPARDLRPLMAGAGLPILAIWPQGPAGNGRKDNDEVAAQYAELEGMTLYALAGHGAGAMLEAPAPVADAMLSFWDVVRFGR